LQIECGEEIDCGGRELMSLGAEQNVEIYEEKQSSGAVV